MLDKTNSGDYEAFGKVTEEFLDALGKRKELKGIFTFFASNYPQYEILIDNDVAMQKGVSIADAMENLSIVVGSTWEQGFIRFGQFYKVYVQSAPEFMPLEQPAENAPAEPQPNDVEANEKVPVLDPTSNAPNEPLE